MRAQARRCAASSTTAIATLKPSAWALVKPRSMHARARVSVSVMAVSSGDFHPDLAGFDTGRVAGDAVAAPGQDALARPDVVHPTVPRTGEPDAREPALGERPAPVRSSVLAGDAVYLHPRQHVAEPVRPTRRPSAATWNGWRDISKHQAVSPRVVGSWRAVSTSRRLTPQASAKRIRRSTCFVPDSSSTMFSSRKSRASESGHSPYTVAHQRGNCDTYW